MSELSERAQRILEVPKRFVVEEPASRVPILDPLTFLLLLPVLPFYLLFSLLNQTQTRRKFAVTEIQRTDKGWTIFEYER